MPQMSPLNWLTLMFYFLICALIVNMMLYNSFFVMLKSNKKNEFKLFNNWKW